MFTTSVGENSAFSFGAGNGIHTELSNNENKPDGEANLDGKAADSDDDLMGEIVLPAQYSNQEEDIKIDEVSQLPITMLPGSGATPDWLAKGRHIDIAVDRANNKGAIFTSGVVKSAADGDESDTSMGDEIAVEAAGEVHPFDISTKTDRSPEKVEFLNKLYEDFEPLLKNRAYKTYPEEDNEIGVLSLIRLHREEKKVFIKSLITSLIEDLRHLISLKLKEGGEQNYLNTFSCEEMLNVMNLLNALIFASDDERIILFQVWVNRASLEPDDALEGEAMNDEHGLPYNNLVFWSLYLKKLILRGDFDGAMSALDESGYEELQASDPQLFSLLTSLHTLLGSYNAATFSADLRAFTNWKRETVGLRDSAFQLDSTNKEISTALKEILCMITGMEVSLKDSCSSWYEYFLGRFMFMMPSKKMIPGYVERALDAFPLDSTYSWETICVDLFESKYLSVVSSLEVLDKSVAAYTSILLSASGMLNSYDEAMESEGASDMIDKQVQDLALSYLEDQDLFSIGVGILVTTGDPKAREILSQTLPTFQIKNNDDFEWCLSVCAKLKLSQTAVQIYNIQGEVLLNQGYEYEALKCFSEADNPGKVANAVWKIFENMLIDSEYEDPLLNERIDENDVESPMLRQGLAPVALLREVLNSKEDSKLPLSKLLKLIEFRYLPPRCKPVLLLILLPYFNTGTFSMDQLIEIIKILNVYEKQIDADTQVKEDSLQMYELAVEKSKDTSQTLEGNEFDWRKFPELPTNCLALILQIRRLISLEISFKFLEEEQ